MKKIAIFILVGVLTSVVTFIAVYKFVFIPTAKKSEKLHIVSFLKDKASPDLVAIKTGDSVQFNSADGTNHDLEQGLGNGAGHTHEHEDKGLGSGNFKADEGYRIQFKKEGIFHFHDHYKPDINITVVVGNKL